MRSYGSIIILLWLVVWYISCIPRRRKSEIIQKYNAKTGEAFAIDTLIVEFEGEHQKFHKEENRDGSCLKWPNLEEKILSNYCRKYLQHSVPTRTTDDATGVQMERTLHYKMINRTITTEIVIVHCKIYFTHRAYSYYITRAPEPTCVYTLDRGADELKRPRFTIINKHCDFESIPLKRNRQEIVKILDKLHYKTGQPIAKDKFLMEYELEHQEMFRKEGGRRIEWPYAMEHSNLDSYCYQYLRICAPTRNCDFTTGSWKFGKLSYQKLDTRKIYVTTIKCQAIKKSKLNYYLTRAPKVNCVYSLLPLDYGINRTFVIKFKHCDFEYLENLQSGSIILKPKKKEEMYDIRYIETSS